MQTACNENLPVKKSWTSGGQFQGTRQTQTYSNISVCHDGLTH